MYAMSKYRIGVTFDDESVFKRVVAMADEDRRSQSSMGAILIERGLRAGELLAAADAVGGVDVVMKMLSSGKRKAA